MFPPQIQQEIDTAAAAEESLQVGWPAGLQLGLWRQSAWYELPYAFLPAFPDLTLSGIRPLSVFGRLFANSIFVHDPLADRPVSPPDVAASTLRIMAMQFEAYRVLHPLFPPDAPFWARLRSYLYDYSSACLEEQRFATGARPWREHNEALAVRLAIGKSGLSRAILAGLVQLAGDESLLTPLTDALNHFNVACHLWDDLNDWREDLRHGVPSLLLSRIAPERPAGGLRDTELERLAREIYYGGHASYTLELALSSLDSAARLRYLVPNLPWYESVDIVRAKYGAVLADLQGIMKRNVQRAQTQPKLSLSLPEPRRSWQRIAWAALLFILRQWQLGFGEARDIVAYSDAAGTSVKCEYGDVFQRALIMDALCDADEVLSGQLGPLLAYEADFLVSQRRTSGVGGWAYFHGMRGLPPDADDLAQVIQGLLRTGRRSDVMEHCEAPLGVLLRDCALADGSFKTWIIPRERRTPEQEHEASFVEPSDTAHEEVVANLLHALGLYDPTRFSEEIRRGLNWLEERQLGGGHWPSTWYHGRYYAIHAGVRAFAALRPDSSSLRRALEFLRSSQRADGGWGVGGEESEPLSTALALLAVASGWGSGGEAGDVALAERALGHLEQHQGQDGSWPSFKLIGVGRDAFTGSRTLTTMFVLKAALAWDRLTASEAGVPPAGGGALP